MKLNMRDLNLHQNMWIKPVAEKVTQVCCTKFVNSVSDCAGLAIPAVILCDPYTDRHGVYITLSKVGAYGQHVHKSG